MSKKNSFIKHFPPLAPRGQLLGLVGRLRLQILYSKRRRGGGTLGQRSSNLRLLPLTAGSCCCTALSWCACNGDRGEGRAVGRDGAAGFGVMTTMTMMLTMWCSKVTRKLSEQPHWWSQLGKGWRFWQGEKRAAEIVGLLS